MLDSFGIDDGEKFQVGDVVYLISGGPKMVIFNINEKVVNCPIACNWFDDELKLQDGEFHPACLLKANDD